MLTKTLPQKGVEEIRVQKRVVNKLDKLQQSFISLELDIEKGITKAVKHGKMSVPDLVNRITKERAFTIPQLQTVRTTNDFFNAIRPHYTFLNCHLLVCLALMLLDPIRAAANEYKRKVDALKKNTAVNHFKDTLQRYSSMLYPSKSDMMVQVKIVLDDTWGREKIWLVEELVKKLFDLRHPDECQWFRVVPGSVMAVFLAPKHMTISMIASASKRRGLMTILGVNAILVGESSIYGETNLFSMFTSLLYDVRNGYDTTELLLKNTKINLNQVIITNNYIDQPLPLQSQQFDNKDTEMLFEILDRCVKIEFPSLLPEFESEVSSGHLTLELLVSCINESIICPIEGLTNVRSVRELFQVIQPYYTPFNNHILQQLALQLSGPNSYTNYEALSTKLLKRAKVFETIKPLQKHFDDSNVSPIMMRVTLTLNDAWQTARMDAVEQLIQFLFNLKHPDELLWHRVRYGSVIIEFLAPKNMMMHLITNSVKQKQLMTLTGVMRLQIGNIVVHKTTQQLTLAELRDELKNLQSTKALAICEGYVRNHPSAKSSVTVHDNNNISFKYNCILTGAYLMLACIYSDSSLVKLLLECGADPNSHDSEGQTALMWASLAGNIRQIELLITYGANINQQRVNGYTALMMAVITGNIPAVKYLIAANADLYCTEISEGLTAIHIAVKRGHIQVLKILLDAKVNVNICSTISRRTCLHEAVYNNRLDIVQLLLKRDANVNTQDDRGLAPLSIAAQKGNLQMVDQLIRANANIEISTGDLQMTPLHSACHFGFLSIVKRLLEAKANIDARDKHLQTPLMCAVARNKIAVVKLLIEKNANLNLESLGQHPPIVYASDKGYAEIVQLLLEGGANKDSHYRNGSTSLHMASKNGHSDIVDILLKAGVNPDTPRDDKITPLYEACLFGRKIIVERLLKAGADINAKTANGETPILAAKMGQHRAIVESLLKAGANP